MAKNSAKASHNSTLGEAQILELANGNLSLEALKHRATVLLTSKHLLRNVLGLAPEDQASFVDRIDQAYRPLDPKNMKYVMDLGNVCSAIQRFPTSTVLSTELEKRGNIAVASGRITDIWGGNLGELRTAIKAFRIYPNKNLRGTKEALWKRVPVWMRLSHPNILQFRGVNMTLFQLSLVYDWGDNGNITQYVASNPRASRPSLLLDVMRGLEYLHSLSIAHGNLKGTNVIIDQRGHARLTEYGLAPVHSDHNFVVAATSGSVGTSRWPAPEIITPTRKGNAMPVMESKAADVFALGMFAVEVFTSKLPFGEQKSEAVVLRILQGDRPKIPGNSQAVGLTLEMWSIFESCWQQDPKKRPTIKEVVRKWQKFGGHDDALIASLKELRYAAEEGDGTSQRKAKTDAPQSRPGAEGRQFRSCSENVKPRKPGGRLRTISAAVKEENGLGATLPNPKSNISQQTPKSEVPEQHQKVEASQPNARVYDTPPRAFNTAKNSVKAAHNSTPGGTQILELANSNLPLEMLTHKATTLLTSKHLVRDVLGLTPQDRAKFVDKIDQAYRPLDSQNVKYVMDLGNVCSGIQRLPTSALLSTGLEKRGNIAAASGGFTDIWRGDLGELRVAIKAFRIYPAQNLREAKEILWKRVPVWMRLSHPNILPFRGVNTTLFQLSLIYDWGQNGNITQYVASHPRAPRPYLLFGVAKGLEYLHSLDIPHGGVKGANVVIDRRGNPRLTEYGLAPINSDPSFTVAATPGSVGISRWLAPEIITPARKGGHMPVMESKAADVFAFGMFAVEVFTGKIPFEEQKNEAVVLRISQGGRPEMPENPRATGLTVEMWNVFESCWRQNPKKRPTAEEVVRRWGKFVGDDDVLNAWPEAREHVAEKTEGTSRRRVKTTATSLPQEKAEPRFRSISENPGPRTIPKLDHLRMSPAVVNAGTRLGAIPQSPDSDVFQQTPKSEVPQQRPRVIGIGAPIFETPPTLEAKKMCCVIM